VDITVNADGGGASVAGVEVYVDNKRISSMLNPPWIVPWAVISGTHELKAVMYTTMGEQASSGTIHVSSGGIRPSPTPVRPSILWISNLTMYKEIPAGVNEVWVDVQPDSAIDHVDIYIDGYPAGFGTGPGFRVNPNWTPTPTPRQIAEQSPTATLEPDAAATATRVKATAQVRETKSARATATSNARIQEVATAKALSAAATAESVHETATAKALTATSTPAPPTDTPLPTATPTFVRYEPLPDPMLGDYVARCQFNVGRHRVTAIGYTKDNREIGRNDAWVIVK
ncbi:MAG TPA: hypothetical protein VM409_00950, partial [Chloroflexia bacterium]|nr:hypothetical protein [Chloroflexia bacterium]